MQANEKLINKSPHFFFTQDVAWSDGLLPCHRPDEFFPLGKTDLAGEMFVLLQQVFQDRSFFPLSGVGRRALDDKTILPEGLDRIAQQQQIG